MGKLSFWRTIFLLFVLCAVEAIALPAQTFKTVASFKGSDGAYPQYGPLVQGVDGNFYGTANTTIPRGYGTVFKITPGGALTTLHYFAGSPTDGAYPYSGLVLATNGNFYGTTFNGGANCVPESGCGTVFKITPSGMLTTLASLDFGDGGPNPFAGLVQATNGNFYGTTSNSQGTVFEVSPRGTLNTLYSFPFDGADGAVPEGALVQATDGYFYGTTVLGGDLTACSDQGCGTVFKITPAGTLTTLHKFGGMDGAKPIAGLVHATDGNFYGTTLEGGDLTACSDQGCGTVFKITPAGALTTLHSFHGSDGSNPSGGLVEATDGNFYGTTGGSGAHGWGTVFKISPTGELTTLHSFCAQTGCSDGSVPLAGLLQATNGSFYGTTQGGGELSCDNPWAAARSSACRWGSARSWKQILLPAREARRLSFWETI